MKKGLIKTPEEIRKMKHAGKLLGQFLQELKAQTKDGISTMDLENKFIELCQKNTLNPSCKFYAPWGFPPFPTGLCLNINEEVVHNYPQKDKYLREGDIVTLDTVVDYQGMYVDHAITYGVGKISPQKETFIKNCERILEKTISKVKSGIRVGVLSNNIEKMAKNFGYSVLKEYAGHGIGHSMHEYPEIPCYGTENSGPELKTGMTIAIEPLICEKSDKIVHFNHWETKTLDGGLFVQVEHTVLVTDQGYEILTLA